MMMKVGDLTPNLTITCTSANAPVDLTGATTITLVCRKEGQSSAFFSRSVSGTAQGVVTYAWQAGDTATAGRLLFEVLVTWPGSKPERFPPVSYLPVDVVGNLS
jgi:hypothetical protein